MYSTYFTYFTSFTYVTYVLGTSCSPYFIITHGGGEGGLWGFKEDMMAGGGGGGLDNTRKG